MPLDEALIRTLTTAAEDASARAYAPYSRFHVGAALLFEDGTITSGCNVENASYGLTSCAERNALFRAISERGATQKIRAFAVYHRGPETCPPCGACLQVMSEFAMNPCVVYYSHGDTYQTALLDDLLPVRFGKDSL